MAKFKVGDVVQLNSGSPLMTVHEVGDYSHSGGPKQGVLCVWFDDKKKVQDLFHEDALGLYGE